MKKLIYLFLILSIYSKAQTTNIPDSNFENYLETHNAEGQAVGINDINNMGNGIANDGLVFTSRIENIGSLIISNQNIDTLESINEFINLGLLKCDSNNLLSLNLTSNLILWYLNCEGNQIENLSFSNYLGFLICANNNLDILDISNNHSLGNLDCHSNQLSYLNVANGNNINFHSDIDEATLDARDNPNLTCIQVDDEVIANNNGYEAWLKDASAIYSENCATASVNGFDNIDISIFPNPVNKYLTIDAGYLDIDKVVFYNYLGKKTLSTKKNNIDLSKINNGMYIVKIATKEGQSIMRKIIKI